MGTDVYPVATYNMYLVYPNFSNVYISTRTICRKDNRKINILIKTVLIYIMHNIPMPIENLVEILCMTE